MSKGRPGAETRQGAKCARNTSEGIARADMANQRVLDTRANVTLGSTHGKHNTQRNLQGQQAKRCKAYANKKLERKRKKCTKL